jgi:hypothetical protein
MKKILLMLFFMALAMNGWCGVGILPENVLSIGVDPGIQILQANGYKSYNFYTSSPAFRDRVEKIYPTIVFSAGRYNDTGTMFGENEAVVESDGAVSFYGAYTQLVPYSEDTSNWTGSGPWTQSINLGDTGVYTVSTGMPGATIDITAGTATIDGAAQATYGSPDQFEVTGAGTITITSDTADPKAQITLSIYRLPYVINSTAGTVSVPLNYSDADEGIKYAIEFDSQLLDALDGVADGSEIVTDGTWENGFTNWTNDNNYYTIVSGRAYHASGSVFNKLMQNVGFSEGLYYEVTVPVEHVSGGDYRIATRNAAGTIIGQQLYSGSETKTHVIRFVAGADEPQIYFSRSDVGVASEFYIGDVSAKQISPAQGELVIEWTPQFDAADLSSDVNILTANDEATSFLFWDQSENKLTAYDGTNTATVDCTPVSGTEYEIRLVYGESSGQKMQLILDGTPGSAVTHAGSFPYDTDLSFAWETSEWQKVKLVKWYKEPQSW